MAQTPQIYLDHNATTPVHSEIMKVISAMTLDWGNPSSVHQHGRRPKQIVRQARSIISSYLGIHPLELVFTSGGSEANNTAIFSVFNREWLVNKNYEAEFITSEVEHPSVSKVFDIIESYGAKVHRVPVNIEGQFDLDFYKSVLNENTKLVSVMYANNETGAVLPVGLISNLAKKFGALVHCDAVQALGKVEFDIKLLDIDFCSFSAHKLYSLKGAGALFIKAGTPFHNLIHGGAQERSRRAGTENTLAITSFGKAVELIGDLSSKTKKIKSLRDKMESLIIENISDSLVLSSSAQRLPNTSNIIFEDVDGESLLMNLDLKGISVSTGAACSSGSSEPSPVLINMGLSRYQAQSSLRVSLGWGTTEDEITKFIEVLTQIILRLRRLKEESAS